MLEGVLAPGGTASEVKIPGYQLAGKTGTANKIDPTSGEYSDSKYVASFVGVAPASNPRLLIAVVVDEPQGAIYGGTVAAPAIGKIALVRAALPADPTVVGRGYPQRSMLLRDLLGDGQGAAPPEVEVTSLAYDARAVAARNPLLLRSRVHAATATTSRRRRSSAERSRSSCERPLGLGVPEVLVDDVRAAMAPVAARLNGDPTARLAVAGITGTNGKTTTGFLTRALLEATGTRTRSSGHRRAGRRRRRGARGAHHARGDRPAGDVRADARRRRPRLRDGGLLARARAAPRRRDPLGGRGVHEPHARPPRLPSDDGGVLPRQAPALQRRAGRADRERRRPVRAAAGGGVRGHRHRGRSTATTRRCARPTCRRASDGSTFTAAGRTWRTALPGRFNVLNALCAIAVCRALGAGDEDLAAALPQAARAPGRLRAGQRGSGLRGARRLRAHARTRSRTCCRPRAA